MLSNSELIRYFLLEAEDYVNTLVEGVEELESKGFDKETVESLFRATHTLKGSASIVKLEKITLLAHKLEDLFEALLNKEIEYEDIFLGYIKKVINSIVNLINEVSTFGVEKSELDNELIDIIDDILEKKEIPVKSEIASTIEVLPVTNTVRIDLELIENILTSLGEILVQKNTLTDKERELLEIIEEISHSGKRLLKEITDFSDRYWLSAHESGQKVTDSFFTDFGDLQFDRYDEYHILLRKVQEITNDISESMKSLLSFSENLSLSFKSISREINYLKDNLVEIRMIPAGKLLHRLAEATRDIAEKAGKLVEVEIRGAEIKVDKPVFDSLYEPIIHIIRNAMQHGIELPEERIEKGKEKTGKVKIEFAKEGKNINIEIKDDGRGIDLEKVKETAIERGIISSDRIPYLTREEILSFIFAPGFSTSEQTDYLSGRGMGLNIVKTAISKLKGTIEVFSEIDKETTFRIKIPQSLSISTLLVFRSSKLEYAVPINYVEEILSLEDFPEAVKEKIINHKNRSIQVKLFSEIFFSSNGKKLEKGYIIIFNFSGIRRGLVVEEVLGHEETTINSFGKFLEGLTQYLGYFISGKGIPRYVIDPLKIYEEEFVLTPSYAAFIEPISYKGAVLVVDDSISVRKSLQNILESKKIRVYSAKDGNEALNVLENKNVDLIITDLEMPIMHGYELITRIRKDPRYRDLPIVVLTSRGTKKHEEKALSLGADGYIVKPFDDKIISQLLIRFELIKDTF